MPPTPTPGTDLPSTLGGAGWEPRGVPHAAELGRVWAPFAVRSAVTPLTDVLLSVPGDETAVDDPAAWLMLERPDPARFAAQCHALAETYRAEGVTPHLFRPPSPTPNHVFACDLFFMTPEGAVLARMAARQRAGEERAVAAELARLGVPLLLTPRGTATFEGADALWLDDRTVLIGVGKRTNAEAVAQIAPLLRAMGATVLTAELSAGVQHLLGAIVPVAERRTLALSAHLTPSLRDALAGWDIVEIPSDEETEERRAMNVVTLRPNRVLMPAGCPRTRERFERAGVSTVEAEVSEYVKAAGAIGCLTGVLGRR